MRGTIKASKSVIYETLDRYKDWKYSDGDLVIGWMKKTRSGCLMLSQRTTKTRTNICAL